MSLVFQYTLWRTNQHKRSCKCKSKVLDDSWILNLKPLPPLNFLLLRLVPYVQDSTKSQNRKHGESNKQRLYNICSPCRGWFKYYEHDARQKRVFIQQKCITRDNNQYSLHLLLLNCVKKRKSEGEKKDTITQKNIWLKWTIGKIGP